MDRTPPDWHGVKQTAHGLLVKPWPILVGAAIATVVSNAARWRGDHRLALRLRQEQQHDAPLPACAPRVSILVAAWNEAHLIGRHIESVLALRYPAVEYVLCAGGTDDTYELAKRYERPGVVVIEQRHGEGKQAALRRCLRRATGEIIFLTDADCLPDDQSVERTLGPILEGAAEATTGGSRPLPEQACPHRQNILVAYRSAVDTYRSARAPSESAGLLGRNAALTRRALERAGGFDAEVASGTDYHLAKRLLKTGVRIRQVPGSEMATHYPEGLRGYVRQQRRWLRNVVLLSYQFRAYRDLAMALRTSLIGLGMLGSVAVWPVAPWLMALWFIAVVHGAAGKVRYLAFASTLRHDRPRRPGGRVRSGAMPAYLLWAIPLTLVEFVAWAWPFADYVTLRHRKRITW